MTICCLRFDHSFQCFPIIVALETSPSNILSGRANALHGILHSKHTSLLNARYVASARLSFDYQKKTVSGQVFGQIAEVHCRNVLIICFTTGYRIVANGAPTALLHRWYSLVRDKRATRQDFLRALVKVFDVDFGKTTQVSVSQSIPFLCV